MPEKPAPAATEIGCGLHCPWSTYATFSRDAMPASGQIILDIRRRTLERTMGELSALGDVTELDAGISPKVARVLISRIR